MPTHQEIDARSLALHRLVAEKVRQHPERFDRARAILERWRQVVCANTQPYLEEWKTLFEQGVDPSLEVALEVSEHADVLRQVFAARVRAHEPGALRLPERLEPRT